jgi:hypothetical protein
MKKKVIIALSCFLFGVCSGGIVATIILNYKLESEYKSLVLCIEDFQRHTGRYPTNNEGIESILLDNIKKNYQGEYMIKKELAEFSLGEFIYLPFPLDSENPKSYKLLFEIK